ncbi:Cucumisin [Vitis vinifera]|uniref:Cucumisin n=1 Tax=Vitis vinifera TaxID=29760 RepID=A0A438ILM9_VITVI|nr:Cucumisin [Vitis vinifera]
MARPKNSRLWFLLLSLICSVLSTHSTAAGSEDDEYIVYMGAKPAGDFSASASHTNMLQQVFGSSRASTSLVRSYKKSFNGFVAKLTEEEMQQMKGMDGVVSIFPNEKKQLHTTRSWDFVGFPQQVKRTSFESDIIIGMLDTGIWPESDSFDDEGFGPPPRKWKGACHGFSNFTCNNKIIGAKYYRSDGEFGREDLRSPRDSLGHGTHTASTAAGGLVSMASLMAWFGNCTGWAFDDAIADGVDIISISAGSSTPRTSLYFHHKFLPMVASVAASTIDRKFFTKVKLGDNKVYKGFSINTFELNDMYPLIYGGDAPNTRGGFRGNTSRFCKIKSLNPNLVKGKIVFCDGKGGGKAAFLAGAIGTLMVDKLPKGFSSSFPLPASRLSVGDGRRIAHYINSTRCTHCGCLVTNSPISDVKGDNRVAQYNIITGTSMACPHATGAAAYIKSFHPTWSPAAIKSALMTTATPMSAKKNPQVEFAYGAGNIDPIKAVHPGLVYDANEIDFVNFLCGQGYTAKALRQVTGDHSVCSKATNGTVWNLNYPSFALSTFNKESIVGTFNRSVTNVGLAVSTYKATIIGAPKGLKIKVKPNILSFTSIGQKQSFVLKVEGRIVEDIVSTSLVWDNGVHQVRSPIVVYGVQ